MIFLISDSSSIPPPLLLRHKFDELTPELIKLFTSNASGGGWLQICVQVVKQESDTSGDVQDR